VKKMVKIAISATEDSLESAVCPTFGRCPGFLIVELENNKIKNKKFVPNPGEGMFRGAGISAAQIVAGEKCSVVITGNVGPNAFGVIRSSGIKVYKAMGVRIKDALEKFAKGKLEEAAEAGMPGRAGGRGMGMGMGRGAGAGRGARRTP
jgi:predicted Fe-Mo cluster-binding NifX family protein